MLSCVPSALKKSTLPLVISLPVNDVTSGISACVPFDLVKLINPPTPKFEVGSNFPVPVSYLKLIFPAVVTSAFVCPPYEKLDKSDSTVFKSDIIVDSTPMALVLSANIALSNSPSDYLNEVEVVR